MRVSFLQNIKPDNPGKLSWNAPRRYGKLRYTLSAGWGNMVFQKSLEMSKIKRIRPFAYMIDMMMQIEWMPDTGVYDTAK